MKVAAKSNVPNKESSNSFIHPKNSIDSFIRKKSFSSSFIQAKLTIGAQNDAYEQEAESMATKVVDQLDSPKSEALVQAKLGNTTKTEKGSNGNQINKSGSSKNSMPDTTKSAMESAFQTDFSEVKIHTNNNAIQMNKEIGSDAFTHGNDIYFNRGKYQPNSKDGQHLLAHELTHTVQQKKGISPRIQRRFNPEDAAAEMVGKEFLLNTNLTTDSGTISYAAGSTITILVWNNASDKVTISAVGSDRKKHRITIDKAWLKSKIDTSSGLYRYDAGVKSQSSNVEKGDKKIEEHKAKESEYIKFKNVAGYQTELTRLEGLQEVRRKALNTKLIQETMYNSFDSSIKKWTDHYNTTIGTPNGWDKLDANIVKSMMFQETEVGTSGTFLFKSPRKAGDPMTRFNLLQAIDSSGENLVIMMNEDDPALATKHKIKGIKKDLYKAQAKVKELEKKKTLTTTETAALQAIYDRVTKKGKPEKKYWDWFYWTDTRFKSAWKEFNEKPAGKDKNVDYDFWVKTGIRWLFKKRNSYSNWALAIKAYNGGGAKAEAYKGNVIGRRNAAKTAASSKKEFIPKREY